MLEKIGTKKVMYCEYDNQEHECTLTDYLIRLTGDTYNNRALIGSQNADSNRERFYWDDTEKAWYANIESEEEINRLYRVFQGTGIKFDLKPIYRITD